MAGIDPPRRNVRAILRMPPKEHNTNREGAVTQQLGAPRSSAQVAPLEHFCPWHSARWGAASGGVESAFVEG
eukprot:15464438-Alexandrium_andersonii.AAC.1